MMMLTNFEMTLKMASAFGVTVDFLLGEGAFGAYHIETVQRIQSIQKMDDSTRTIGNKIPLGYQYGYLLSAAAVLASGRKIHR